MEGKSKSKSGCVLGLTTATLLSLSSSQAAGRLQFSSFQTHSHLEIPVDSAVAYTVEGLEENGRLKGIRVTLDGLKEELPSVVVKSDPRTQSVTLTQSKSDQGYKAVYEVVLSPLAQRAGVEFFDYRNQTPSEVSLDYWLKNQPIASNSAERNLAKEQPKVSEKRKLKPVKIAKKSMPEFAGCGEPIRLDADGLALWKVYHKYYQFRPRFDLESADARYEYPMLKPKKSENLGTRQKEIAHYRLIFKLYKESKFALALRAIDFFERQFGSSELIGEIDFLKANTLVKLSKHLRTDRFKDQALEKFRKIWIESAGTPKGDAALMYLTQEYLEKHTPMITLEYALAGSQQDSELKSTYGLIVAETLLSLGEFEKAENAYQVVIDQGTELAPEAAFRVGEVFLMRKFWERGAISFENALKNFPAEANRFPSAWFNLAEAYFRMQRFAEAERVYKQYLSKFATDEAAWAAQLRLGELAQLQLKSPDASKHARIEALYIDTVNRYPYTIGAKLAELRLSSCYGKMAAHDANLVFYRDFFAAAELKKMENPLVNSKEIEVWFDLAEARFRLANGEPALALKKVAEFRPILAKMPLGEQFRLVFSKALASLIKDLVHQKNSPAILKAVEDYGDFAEKPYSLSYLLAVADSNLELTDLAGLAKSLSEVEARLGSATDAEKDRYHLFRAYQQKLLASKPERVMAELSRISDNGEYVFEKYDELAQAAIAKDDMRAAIAYDSKIIDTPLSKGLDAKHLFEIHARRAENVNRSRDVQEAIKLASQALLKFGTLTDMPETILRMKEIIAQGLYDSGDFRAAIPALAEIISEAPEHPRKTEFEFMRGKSLSALGRENEAIETFRKLASADKEGIWKKSAQAELDQLSWENSVSNQMKDRRSK